MTKEIHFGPKDFKVEWYSGSGAGGQHRNKHQNCCRITHIESGLKQQGTSNKSRVANQREAFEKLAKELIELYSKEEDYVDSAKRFDELVRRYHAVNNEVKDMASGLRAEFKEVVEKNNLGLMIDARRKACLSH